MNGKITVAGIGPECFEDLTPAVQTALHQANAVVGYSYYFQFVQPFMNPGAISIDTGMNSEVARAEQAFLLTEIGQHVCVLCDFLERFTHSLGT